MSYQLGPVDPQERAGFSADPADRREPRRRRALSSMLALAVMAVFAGGVWLAYVEGGRQAGGGASGDVPLIRADPSPMKRRPAEPGGMQIPDRNMLIFGERHSTVEHLLPPPEAPMPRPAPPAQIPSIPSAVAPAETDSLPADGKSAAVSTAATARPEHALAASSERRQPEKKSASAQPQEKPTPAARAPREKARGTRLQLGALRSPAAAREEWRRLKRANPALLGKLSASTVRADLGAKGVFYRIETEPFADAAAADRLCAALKRRNFRCLIAR